MHRFQPRDRWLLLVAVALLAILAVGRLLPGEAPLAGGAIAVDGDTLRLGGQRVRIVGIDAPELAQQCTDATGAPWGCGEAARARMVSLVRGNHTACRPQGRDRYGRVIASCAAGEADLGDAMVRGGLAVADGGYFESEALARTEKVGIWSGTFVLPAQWRRQHAVAGDSGLWATIRGWFR